MNSHQLLLAVVFITAHLFSNAAFAAVPPKGAPSSKAAARPRDAVDALPPYFGLKRLIAVTRFDNKSGYQGQLELGNGLADLLTDALARAGRFIIVERLQVQDALREQDFARSGRAVEAGAPEIGRLLNTQAIVIGTVTHYDEHLMVGTGSTGQGGAQFQVSTATARLEINLRVVDTTTGEIVASQSSRASDQASVLASAFGGSGFAKTATGKVCIQAITDAVAKLCRAMDEVPWRGRVVDVRGDDILINAGLALGIVPGDCFRVFKHHDLLLDPETGLPLGSPMAGVGVVEERAAKEKFATARRVAGGPFERGQIARLVPAWEVESLLPASSALAVPPWPPDPPEVAAAREKNSKTGGSAGLLELAKFLKSHPDDPNGLLAQAQIVMKSASADKHITVRNAQRLSQLRPTDPEMPMLEGCAALARNDAPLAYDAFERCLELTPGDLGAVLLQRRAAAMLGLGDEVFRASRRAINLGYRPRPRAPKPPESFGPRDPLAHLPPIYGPKMRVAISPFAMKINKEAVALLGMGLTDAVADRLASTGRFILVERQRIEDVLREQDFSKTGRTVEAAAPAIGRLLSAQALMFGSVMRFDWAISKSAPAFQSGGAQFEVATAVVHLGAATRLVDATTGQVVYSKQTVQRKSKPALGGTYASDTATMNSPAMARLPIAEVQSLVVDELALDIARSLQQRAWLGRIADVRGEDVFVNAGAEQGIMPGDCFLVLSEQELQDPETGLPLGTAKKGLGAIEVRHVEPKFSIARAVRGSGFARNHALKFVPAHVVKGPAAVAKAQPPPPDSPAVAEARAIFAKSGFYLADRKLDETLAKVPNDASALWLRMELNLKSSSGSKQQAMRDARRLEQLRPADPALPLFAARAAVAARDDEAALAALDRALALDPQNLDTVLWHKELAEKIGDMESAARDDRRAFNLGADPAKAKRGTVGTKSVKSRELTP
ncbi:MAG: hypothetical protein HZA91_17875 [Verrucomicrobia bacterium]|nr:hypothetical protein [Verrucomicrobiota bacterium]